MAEEQNRPEEDVRRALATTWKGVKRPISFEELVRMWCFDTQWFDVDVAEKAISSLVDKGWIEITNQGIVPCTETRIVTAPLGWWPRIESLTNPPNFDSEASFGESQRPIREDPPTAAPELAPSVKKDGFDDPRMLLVPRLTKYIAKIAELEILEVERRMERKQRSLGPITPWMCLIFIAMEQGLPVDEIVETFI